jgi:hypothetical protein
MRQLLVLAIAIVCVAACGKDKIATKPSLKIKSISSDVIPANFPLQVGMEFTDKEGDLLNLFLQKIRINKKVVPTLRDTLSITVPEFTTAQRGEIDLRLDYQNYLVSALNPTEDDTLIIRFVLRDKAGNVSDTVSAGTIVVQR